VPHDDFLKLNEAIGNEALDVEFGITALNLNLDCENLPFKTLSLTLANNVVLNIPPSALVLQIDGSRSCLSLIKESNGRNWSIGSQFMQEYVTVFDRDNSRVGFAKNNS
jgi:hypothetical protein